MIEKVLEINLLYDFYGQLLTDKQMDIVELYYNNDLSLGEIAESFEISRQAVYDILKRSEKQLYQYEEKLKLVQKFIDQKNKLKIAYKLLDSIENSKKVEEIKAIIDEIMETNI
jgi:uncharacterized protein